MKNWLRVWSMLLAVMLLATTIPAMAEEEIEVVAAPEEPEFVAASEEIDWIYFGDDDIEVVPAPLDEPDDPVQEQPSDWMEQEEELTTEEPEDVLPDTEEEELPVNEGDDPETEEVALSEGEEELPEDVLSRAKAAIVPEFTELIMGQKETVSAANYTLLPSGSTATVTYTSSAPKVVQVDENGLMTARNRGTAVVRLSTDTGLTADINITVVRAPSKVTMTGARKTIGVGETLQLGYTLSSAAGSRVTFSTADPSIATVTEDGAVTGVKAGAVKITVTTYNGRSDTVTMTVVAAPKSIKAVNSDATIGLGDSWTMGYTIDGGAAAVTFKSSAPAVASVDDKGVVSALKKGTATITVTTYNGLSAQSKITVGDAPTSVALSATELTLGIKETIKLTAKMKPEGTQGKLTWKSSKPKVASVSEDGTLTALKSGSAAITATTYNGKTASVTVTVLGAPSKVTVKLSEASTGVGGSVRLAYELPKKTAGSITWSASPKDMVTISEDGAVTALRAGSVTLTGTTYNGKSSSITLRIYEPPTSITFPNEKAQVAMGESITVAAALNENAGGSITYASANEKIAKVDAATGKVTGVKVGTTTITARSYVPGVETSMTIEVLPACTFVKLPADTATIGVGQIFKLVPTVDDGVTTTFTYTSAKPKYASVDANGVITGLRKGSVKITVTTGNGKTAAISVTVLSAPSKVTVKLSEYSTAVGGSVKLTYELPSKTAGTVTWSANPKDAVSIAADGTVTALKAGAVKLTGTTQNGKSDSVTLKIYEPPTSITFPQKKAQVAVGESITVAAKLNENAGGSITYSSANEKVAKVDAGTGKVTGVKAGTTKITAKSYVPGVETSMTIEVLPACTFVKLPYTTVTMGVGDALQLSPIIDEGVTTTFAYTSAKTRYATVSASGLITGVKAGTTTITVTTGNGKTCKLTVKVVKASYTKVAFDETKAEVSVGAKLPLSWSVSGTDVATVKFAVEDKSIATVDANGVVTGVRMGTTRVKVTAYNGNYAICEVKVIGKPEAVSIRFPDSISVGEKVTAAAVFAPDGSSATATWSVASGTAITVSDRGVVTGVKKGTAVLKVTAGGLTAQRTVQVLPAPTTLTFSKSKYTVDIGETLKLEPIVDDGTAVSFNWKIATEGYFTIDESGVVQPIELGSSKVTCTTANGLSATITVEVADLYTPTDAMITNAPGLMEIGDTWTPAVAVKPSTASTDMKWTTSNADILTLDSKTNTFYALTYGVVTVTGTSKRNSTIKVSVRIAVDNPELELTIPDRRTYTTGMADSEIKKAIEANKAKIRSVRDCALKVAKQLYATGVINKTEYNNRTAAIERAFAMYDFAWMTDSTELYWRAANSENGAKDFKPGVVYYGMPYTQSNRVNNVDSVVSSGYWTNTGKGYYKLNGSKFSNRQYPGNDCSAFASMSVWGKSSSRASDTTRNIGSASYYVTITDWTAMRTGDLINKSGAHVIIFLYYTDAAKTQFMLIEQGGGEDAINTVSCNVRTVAYYRDNGYSIRRPK